MEAIPRNDGEQYRFDAFCKAVLRNEARNYHRNKKRLLDREKSFSVLSLEELGQLTSVDHYPSEEFVFSSYGCDLHIDNELVANAFAALPKQEQSILILFCVLELGDGEIGDLMGMSRSAVQRHRTKGMAEDIARFTRSEVLYVRHSRWQSMMIGCTKIHLNFSLPQSL